MQLVPSLPWLKTINSNTLNLSTCGRVGISESNPLTKKMIQMLVQVYIIFGWGIKYWGKGLCHPLLELLTDRSDRSLLGKSRNIGIPQLLVSGKKTVRSTVLGHRLPHNAPSRPVSSVMATAPLLHKVWKNIWMIGTWWLTTHGSWLWVSSPQWLTWDFWNGLTHSKNWGELTHIGSDLKAHDHKCQPSRVALMDHWDPRICPRRFYGWSPETIYRNIVEGGCSPQGCCPKASLSTSLKHYII